MAGAANLQAKLAAGEMVLLDGAIGTELERLGAPMHDGVWCGHALETHPQLVSEVHRSYIAAGAEIITANTYSIPPHAMKEAGLEDRTESWNALAMQLAVKAREEHGAGQQLYVAGSISPFGSWRKIEADQLKPSYEEQARILVDQGADLLLLETLATTPEGVLACLEATSNFGVPVWLALSCLENRETGELMHGVQESQEHSSEYRPFRPYGDVIRECADAGASTILTMHSDLNVAEAAVGSMKDNFGGPFGVYPNAGYWLRPQWAFVDQVTPEVYLAEAKKWKAGGAQIIGGCCGIGPDLIKAVHDGLF